MRLLPFLGTAVCLVLLVACEKQPSSDMNAANSAIQEDALAADVNSNVASTSEVDEPEIDEPEIDYGDWLRLPEGLAPRFQDPYPNLVQLAMAGDPEGQMNLALLSQQIAMTLARGGKEDEAYAFLLQSGRALREGMPGGAEFLPVEDIANIYFNSAGALARSGHVSEAVSALDEAVANGFSELSTIDEDPALAPVRESEGFAQRLEGWRQAIKQRVLAEVRRDLEMGETFPFEFSGTDIHGNEQSLAALKGKVVIVDFWGTWCPPCRAEIPSFVRLQESYAERGFQMIGLNYERKDSDEENLKAVLDFAEEFSINYPCLLSDDETQAQVPSFRGFPTTLFIDRSGKVRLKVVGLHDYDYLDAVVTTLLAETE